MTLENKISIHNYIFSVLEKEGCMNKAELIEKMAKDADISKAAAKTALESFFDGVTKGLKKKNSKVERATRAAVATIPSMLTPKAIPSLVAMAAPDAIFKDKKKRTVRIMGRDIPIDSIREFVGRYHA